MKQRIFKKNIGKKDRIPSAVAAPFQGSKTELYNTIEPFI